LIQTLINLLNLGALCIDTNCIAVTGMMDYPAGARRLLQEEGTVEIQYQFAADDVDMATAIVNLLGIDPEGFQNEFNAQITEVTDFPYSNGQVTRFAITNKDGYTDVLVDRPYEADAVLVASSTDAYQYESVAHISTLAPTVVATLVVIGAALLF
jgi:hypothetical protein